jgi:predicted nucleic acid-binding protein
VTSLHSVPAFLSQRQTPDRSSTTPLWVCPQHEQAKDFSEDAVRPGSRLYVTWDIISETLTLLRYRRSYREALTFLTEIKPHLHIVNYSESVRTEAEQIFRRYGRDHKLSFSDAVSFVVVTTLEARNNSKRNPFGLEFWNLAFRKFEIVSDFVI